MTVRELSAHLGVSVRTLRYYDEIGLLKPKCRTEQGYRDYDAAEIRRLRVILALRALQFSLKQIMRFWRLHRQSGMRRWNGIYSS